MRHRTTLPVVAALLVLASLATGLRGSAGAAATPTSGSTDPAVLAVARQRGVSLEEAQRRIDWQTAAGRLADELPAALGARFGGVWIDRATDRVQIGVVGGPVDLRGSTTRLGLSGAVDIVPVRHSLAKLEAASLRLGKTVFTANRDAAWHLRSGLRTDRNAVILQLPRGRKLTAAQHAVVADAKQRYGTLLLLGTFHGRKLDRTACSKPPSGLRCDPPLRGGMRIYSAREPACTAGFIAKSRVDSTKYLMTAGHCINGSGEQWNALFSNGEGHPIGPVHNSRDNATGDTAIIRISNPSGWNPKHWVFLDSSPDVPDYYIIDDQASMQNQRVCLTGAVGAWLWGTTCGRVIDTNVPGFYGDPEVLVDYLCATQGDSGGPLFSSHVAYGTLASHPVGSECGETQYFDIRRAEQLMNVDVIHGG
jgi:hypothetical protein